MKLEGKKVCLIILVACTVFAPPLSFEDSQKKNPRVSDAFNRKEEFINMKCGTLGIPPDVFGNMLIRVFKAEAIMEVWVKNPEGKYIKFNDFNIYAMSGKLGPKRRQGDHQVPEGFYYINDFNPCSNYHLSLGINYPNESDLKLSPARDKGGAIYIHGARVSAGCMAMSDYYIEDIYICAVKAKNGGQQKIPVEIFPFRPTEVNLAYYSQFEVCREFTGFWKNLAQGYNFFEKNKQVPVFTVGKDGSYVFQGTDPSQALK